MINLDDIAAIKKLDEANCYGSVVEFYKQGSHAWEDTKNLQIPDSYKKVNKILLTGMGGSGLGARIIEAVYGPELNYPLARLNDYDLPDWVDESTLVICSSFSGTTEETVENAHQARKKGAKWMTIAAGNTLIDLAKQYQVPYYQINPRYNPSNQPRMAVGYSVFGQLAMTSKTGLFKLTETEVNKVSSVLEKMTASLKVEVPAEKNLAKKISLQFHNKKVVFVGAKHLFAAAHTAKNQMNENAKNFSALFDIPELNHHLMEGLRFPESNKNDLIFVFANSDLYPKRIQERFQITEDVVRKNSIATVSWKAESDNKLSQVFELIQFFGFVNFYLSMLNNLNPAPIPWVDYFKTKLGQPLGK